MSKRREVKKVKASNSQGKITKYLIQSNISFRQEKKVKEVVYKGPDEMVICPIPIQFSSSQVSRENII